MSTAAPAEIELVLALSTPRLREDEVERARELLRAPLDWNAVLGLLVVHRTVGVAWHNMVEHGLRDRRVFRQAHMLQPVEVLFRGQRIRGREQIEQNVLLSRALSAHDVPHLVLKGAAVARLAYPDLGMRLFNDNDYLIPSTFVGAASVALKELGYVQGRWDPVRREAKPVSRQELLLHTVSAHETYPYVKPVPDGVSIEVHRVDLHFSLDLLTSNRDDELVNAFIERRVNVGTPESPLWSADRLDMFVFLCVHFQREAAHRNEVERGKDLMLYKLTDLLALLRGTDAPVTIEDAVARSIELGLTDEVYFTLSYLDILYPGTVPAGALTAITPDSPTFLDEVHDDRGTMRVWPVPIRERFFDARRARHLAGS